MHSVNLVEHIQWPKVTTEPSAKVCLRCILTRMHRIAFAMVTEAVRQATRLVGCPKLAIIYFFPKLRVVMHLEEEDRSPL